MMGPLPTFVPNAPAIRVSQEVYAEIRKGARTHVLVWHDQVPSEGLQRGTFCNVVCYEDEGLPATMVYLRKCALREHGNISAGERMEGALTTNSPFSRSFPSTAETPREDKPFDFGVEELHKPALELIFLSPYFSTRRWQEADARRNGGRPSQ